MAVNWKNEFPNATQNEPIEYLIDGKEYYDKLYIDFASLTPGDSIYIMGWMFDHDFNMFPHIPNMNKSPLDLFARAVSNKIDVKIFIWDNPLYIQRNIDSIKYLKAAGVDIRMEASKLKIHKTALSIMQTILPSVYATISAPLLALKMYASYLNVFGIVINKLDKFIDMLNYVKSKVTGGISNISVCAYHDKVTIIIRDSKVIAYCGGIDYNRNRVNNSMHDVQCRVEGPAASQILNKFLVKWNEYLPAANKIVSPAISSFTLASKNMYSYGYAVGNHNYSVSLPDFHRTLSDAYFKIIDKAEKYIYIEDQYMVNQEVAAALNAKLNSSKVFDLILLIQCDENTLEDLSIPARMRTRFIEIVRGAAIGASSPLDSKITVLSIDKNSAAAGNYPSGIHSKIMIADDEIAIIGSSNVNQRSFTHDGETSLIIFDDNVPANKFAKKFRLALWRKYAFITSPSTPTPSWIDIPFIFRSNVAYQQQKTMLSVYAPNIKGDLDQVIQHFSPRSTGGILAAAFAAFLGYYNLIVATLKTILPPSFFNDFFRYIVDPHLDKNGNHSTTPPKF